MTTILIAEDSATVRRLVESRMTADGYAVLSAEDGEEAIALALEHLPDLVILDKVMPKVDGFEVVRELRSNPSTAAIPIIMLTDRGGERDVITGLDLGVEEYMPKPFSPRELSMRVRRLVPSNVQ